MQKSLTSSCTSRRPCHSLIAGWKASEQTVSAASLRPFSAMFQAIDLDDHAPLRDAELEVVLAVADDPGFADDADPVGHEQGPRVADPVGLERLDLVDDARGQEAQGDLGVDLDPFLRLFGGQGRSAVVVEPLGEGGELRAGELQARGGGVAAEADQPLGAGWIAS